MKSEQTFHEHEQTCGFNTDIHVRHASDMAANAISSQNKKLLVGSNRRTYQMDLLLSDAHTHTFQQTQM